MGKLTVVQKYLGPLIIFSAFFGCTVLALPAPLWSEATYFFRTPTSPFPSGQTSRKDLEKNQKNSDLEVGYSLNWNNKKYHATSEQLITELQTSTWALSKTESLLQDQPLDRAQAIHKIRAETALSILKTWNHWSMVYDGQKVGWIATRQLKSVKEDRGVFIALLDTYLRTEPRQGSPILSMASKDSQWKPLQIQDEWLEVMWNGQKAYLDLAHFAHRSDFATAALHQDLGWIPIEYRSGGTIFGTDKKNYKLKDFTAFQTDPQKAIMKDSITGGPQLRSRVLIESYSSTKWIMSRLDGHGDVWWKKDILEEKPVANMPSVTLRELLQTDLQALSIEGHNKAYGLASSHGVYRTLDGAKWEKIQDFGDQDLPVCVHPEGAWFVGSFRSFDQGKTFEPFLRWDLVTEMIQNELGRPPLFMKVVKLTALKNSQVDVTIDSGYKKIKFRGHILGQFWKVVK